ncbi:hypothetical protein GCM10027355_16200 [Haloplanus salinarum]
MARGHVDLRFTPVHADARRRLLVRLWVAFDWRRSLRGAVTLSCVLLGLLVILSSFLYRPSTFFYTSPSAESLVVLAATEKADRHESVLYLRDAFRDLADR